VPRLLASHRFTQVQNELSCQVQAGLTALQTLSGMTPWIWLFQCLVLGKRFSLALWQWKAWQFCTLHALEASIVAGIKAPKP